MPGPGRGQQCWPTNLIRRPDRTMCPRILTELPAIDRPGLRWHVGGADGGIGMETPAALGADFIGIRLAEAAENAGTA